MSIVPINIGGQANDGNGQTLRSGGALINANFAELDTRTATAQETAEQGVADAGTAQAAAVSAQAKADAAIPQSAAGVSIAQLVSGVVPSGQLPSYVDDVLEFPTLAYFPPVGETGKIYLAINDGDSPSNPTRQYRWSSTAYVVIPSSPGSTDEVAEGSTNLYFTVARVRAAVLTGLNLAVGTVVTAADTLLVAIGKLQKQITDLATSVAGKAASGANSDITSLTGLTTPLGVSQGGTGVANTKGLQDLVGANYFSYIHNGSNQVAQFGTSFSVSAGSNTLDRWACTVAGGAVVTVAQEASGMGIPEFQFDQTCTVTTAAALAAGTRLLLSQQVEGMNARRLVGKTFAFTFEVASSLPGVYTVAFRSSGGDRSFVAEFAIAAANTPQTVSIPVPNGLITAGTWDWANGVGLRASFCLACGSTFQTGTKNAWVTGDFAGTSAQVNFAATVGNKFRITGVRLTEGDTAKPFQAMSYADDLRTCQRYAYRMWPSFMGVSLGTQSIARAGQNHPVTMRGAPAVTAPNNVSMWDGGSIISGGPAVNYSTANVLECDFNSGSSGLTAGRPGKIFTNGSATAYLDVRADI